MILKKILLCILIFSFFIFAQQGEKTRDYLKAGSFWYPSTKSGLNSVMDSCLKNTKKVELSGKIRGLIAPHAGFSASGLCAAWGYKQIINLSGINRIFILGVSHRGGFYGACVSDFIYNSTPIGKIPVDTKITKKLSKEKFFRINNRIMQYEHSIENQLPFLQRVLKNKGFKIVPILFGQLKREDFKLVAGIIKKYVDEKTLVIASTDFTHYGNSFGYVPFKSDIKNNLTRLDMGMINTILDIDFDRYTKYMQKTRISMCGFIPVGVLINIFSGKEYNGHLINYYKSGDLDNNYSLSVSYAAIVILEKKKGTKSSEKLHKKKMDKSLNLSVKEKKNLILIARETLNTYFKNSKYIKNPEKKFKLTANLKQKAGVFVTLNKGGHLRGCIGSIVGRKPLYQGVMENVINAAVRDPRFSPVKEDELNLIHIEISVMTSLKKIHNYKKIRLGIDGVIIKRGYNQAVYLPQVATETGWNLDEFLSHLCQKADLYPDSYKSKGIEFYIFQASVFEESK